MKIKLGQKLIDIVRKRHLNLEPIGEYYKGIVKDFLIKEANFKDSCHEIEFLAVGSSHGECGFNPKYFDGKLFNYCLRDQDLYYSYQLYKQKLKKAPKLKTIIVSYSVFSAGWNISKSGSYPHCFYYKLISKLPYRYLFNKFNSQLKTYKDFVKNLEKQNFTNTNGYLNFAEFCFGDDYNKKRFQAHLRENEREERQLFFIKKMANLAKRNKHKLIIAIPPFPDEYKNALPPKEALFDDIYQLCKNLNLSLIEYYEDADFSNQHFGDIDHMNNDGSKLFSNKVKFYLHENKLL